MSSRIGRRTDLERMRAEILAIAEDIAELRGFPKSTKWHDLIVLDLHASAGYPPGVTATSATATRAVTRVTGSRSRPCCSVPSIYSGRCAPG